MAAPVFFVENLFSLTQFASAVLSASSSAAGYEAWRLANGRRSAHDRWQAAAAGAAWIQVDLPAARTVDMLALDRGHNLWGLTLSLQTAPASGGPWTTQRSFTLPAAAAAARTALGAANGVRTAEGAWLVRFAAVTARYYRLSLPAFASAPQIVGAWLGRGWTPTYLLDLPLEDLQAELLVQEVSNAYGWAGAGAAARVRSGEIRLKLAAGEYDSAARYHLEENFWRRRPMWIIHDADYAERAVLAIARAGTIGFRTEPGWAWPQGAVRWVEHEPEIRA